MLDRALSRRAFVASATAATAAGLAAGLRPHRAFAAPDPEGAAPPIILGEGQYRYECQHDWGRLPETIQYGLTHGVAVDRGHPGATNEESIASIEALIDGLDGGLVFANLVETDQVYGHRKDAEGFHRALREIDAAAGRWLAALHPGDLLVLTADHGCDITRPGSDHTREHAPLLARFDGHGGRRHDGPLADVGASVLRWLTGEDAPGLPGQPFVD